MKMDCRHDCVTELNDLKDKLSSPGVLNQNTPNHGVRFKGLVDNNT